MTNAVAKTLEERLALQAAAAGGDSEGIPYISTQHGRLTYKDQQLPGDKVEAVVLSAVYERTCYEGTFDPDNVEPPMCFALGKQERDLTPHPNVKEPINETCKGCPKAEFGTAAVGKGPACKTKMRLVLMPIAGADTPSSVADADLAILKVAPTSVKNWKKYSASNAASGKLDFMVNTEVKNAPHPKKMFEQTFTKKGDIDAKVLKAIETREKEAEGYAMRAWAYDDE